MILRLNSFFPTPNNSLCSERGLPLNNSDMPFLVEYLSTGKSPLEICSGIIERIRCILTYAIRKQVGWIKTNFISFELWKLSWQNNFKSFKNYIIQVFHRFQLFLNLVGKLFYFTNLYQNFSNLNLFYSVVSSIL